MKQLHKHAIISRCEKYRYKLTRTWDEDKKKVLFIMLNPSTANHVQNDLTTIRCINFAEKWGYGGIMIGNIYPFRAKRPKDLKKWLEISMNPMALNENMKHVREMAKQTDLIVCAWGCNFPYMPNWVSNIDSKMGLHYLELCKDGITPKHPLGNLSKDLVPKQYKLNTIIDG
jgi:hypothetical protein